MGAIGNTHVTNFSLDTAAFPQSPRFQTLSNKTVVMGNAASSTETIVETPAQQQHTDAVETCMYNITDDLQDRQRRPLAIFGGDDDAAVILAVVWHDIHTNVPVFSIVSSVSPEDIAGLEPEAQKCFGTSVSKDTLFGQVETMRDLESLVSGALDKPGGRVDVFDDTTGFRCDTGALKGTSE